MEQQSLLDIILRSQAHYETFFWDIIVHFHVTFLTLRSPRLSPD